MLRSLRLLFAPSITVSVIPAPDATQRPSLQSALFFQARTTPRRATRNGTAVDMSRCDPHTAIVVAGLAVAVAGRR